MNGENVNAVPGLFRTAGVVFKKEMLVEWRSREISSATLVFAILVAVMCAFAFDLPSRFAVQVGTGALWISICLGGLMAVGRGFQREREMGVWTGVLLSPASRSGIYLGKVTALVVLLAGVSALLLPVLELLFHLPFWRHASLVLLAVVLGVLGFSAVSTVVGAMVAGDAIGVLMLGVVLFPLVSPVLIMGAAATRLVLWGHTEEALAYLRILVIVDGVFLMLGLWLFGPVVDD